MVDIMGKMYATEKEAASMLGYSVQWMRKMRSKNIAPPYMRLTPKGNIYFEKAKLEEWVKKNMIDNE